MTPEAILPSPMPAGPRRGAAPSSPADDGTPFSELLRSASEPAPEGPPAPGAGPNDAATPRAAAARARAAQASANGPRAPRDDASGLPSEPRAGRSDALPGASGTHAADGEATDPRRSARRTEADAASPVDAAATVVPPMPPADRVATGTVGEGFAPDTVASSASPGVRATPAPGAPADRPDAAAARPEGPGDPISAAVRRALDALRGEAPAGAAAATASGAQAAHPVADAAPGGADAAAAHGRAERSVRGGPGAAHDAIREAAARAVAGDGQANDPPRRAARPDRSAGAAAVDAHDATPPSGAARTTAPARGEASRGDGGRGAAEGGRADRLAADAAAERAAAAPAVPAAFAETARVAQEPARVAARVADESAPLLSVAVAAPGLAPTDAVAEPAAPPPSYPVTVPLADPRFPTALGERVTWLVREGLQSAELVLNPQELGPIRIELSMAGDAASIGFSAAHADTRAAIEQALPRLRELLEQQGLQLGGAQVDGGRQSGHDERRPRAQRADPGAALASLSGAGAAEDVVASAARPGPRPAAGRVDVFA